MKLPLREAEFAALLDELTRWDGYVSSALLGVEAIRAFLESVALLPLDDSILDQAAELSPGRLRSLDASTVQITRASRKQEARL